MIERDQWEWLRAAATRLSLQSGIPVDLKGLLRQLRIDLERSTSGAPTILTKPSPRSYKIVLAGSRAGSREELSSGDRFAVAHEIGHVLLDYEFGFRPTNRRHYHAAETLCNAFASWLLVPDASLEEVRIKSWAELPRVIQRIHVSHAVPLATAAHRVADRFPKLWMCEALRVSANKRPRPLRIRWTVGNASLLDVVQNRRITPSHLLSGFLDAGSWPRRLSVAVNGTTVRVYGFRLTPSRYLLAARSPSAVSVGKS